MEFVFILQLRIMEINFSVDYYSSRISLSCCTAVSHYTRLMLYSLRITVLRLHVGLKIRWCDCCCCPTKRGSCSASNIRWLVRCWILTSQQPNGVTSGRKQTDNIVRASHTFYARYTYMPWRCIDVNSLKKREREKKSTLKQIGALKKLLFLTLKKFFSFFFFLLFIRPRFPVRQKINSSMLKLRYVKDLQTGLPKVRQPNR